MNLAREERQNTEKQMETYKASKHLHCVQQEETDFES